MINLPFARHQDIVVQEFNKEILVYNLLTHKIYNLNETSAIVYQACGDRTTFTELKRKNKFTDDLILFALDELKREGLIEGESPNHFGSLTRREVIHRVGLSSFVALPIIIALSAPKAQAAQSCVADGAGCVFNNSYGQGECCSGSRCFNTSQCGACRPSLQQYPGCPFAGCCSSAGARGSCCDSVSAPTEVPSGGSLFNCFCP